MQAQATGNNRRKISEGLAAAAMALLLTYIADAAVGQGKTGFLPMTEAQRGMILGTTSIALFFAAFGVMWKQRSKVAAVLLIAGGAIMGTSVVASSAMAEGGLGKISASFLGVIVAGYVIMGLGIWQMARTSKAGATHVSKPPSGKS
jgi:hypothetical protein